MRDKAKLLRLISATILFLVLNGCVADTKYVAFIPIGHNGWLHTDTLTYAIDPLTDMERSGFSLLLHSEGYRYKNIALDITISQDTILLYHEQRSFLLEHNLPRKGIGRRYDYVLPVGNFILCDTLATTISITHRLNQSKLVGIREVGVRIGPPLHQPGESSWKVDWH